MGTSCVELQGTSECCNRQIIAIFTGGMQLERAGLCCNRGQVCCNQCLGRCCNGWSEGVATNGTSMLQPKFGEVLQRMVGEVFQQTAGREVLQPTFESGRCCNGWAEGVAMNGRGGMGKMQQDIAIFHGGWTTVNDATAIYGSYHKSCNKVPCTLLHSQSRPHPNTL